MNRELKFRFWGKFGELNEEKDECENEMLYGDRFCFFESEPINDLFDCRNFQVMQGTGLKDKNGVEIYEYMEIDNTYEVSFLKGSYVLTNISNGDIMLLSNYMENNNGKIEITREYTKPFAQLH